MLGLTLVRLLIAVIAFLISPAVAQQKTDERGDEGSIQDYLILALIIVGSSIILLIVIF